MLFNIDRASIKVGEIVMPELLLASVPLGFSVNHAVCGCRDTGGC